MGDVTRRGTRVGAKVYGPTLALRTCVRYTTMVLYTRNVVSEVPDEIDLFSAVVTGFCRRPRTQRSPHTTANALVRLRRVIAKLELEFSDLASDFAATDEYEQDAACSPIQWMKHH